MQQIDEIKKERMELASERISKIAGETSVPAPYGRYFREEALFIVQMLNLAEQIGKNETQQWSLEEWKRCNESIYADIDVSRIASERRRMTTFDTAHNDDYRVVGFKTVVEELELIRYFDKAPFVPSP